MTNQPDVLIIGGGPAGLTAATALRRHTGASVVVVDREKVPGGIPRHSDHLGYGIRDLRTVVSGPKYAQRLVDEAIAVGVEIRTNTMVTAWDQQSGAHCTSPRGVGTIEATATLLATGARERPRPARMIPGGRPAGIFTTGELQNAVHVQQQNVGTRAVVVGGQLVSWSAVMTLREAHCQTVAMLTEHPRAESYGIFNAAGRAVFRTPVYSNSRVVQIFGRYQVTGVEIEDVRSGRRRVIECDTVVMTGDWVPDHELARTGGLTLDPGTRGPLVDAIGRTSSPGVFAAGNTVHPVDTADIAALGGRHTAGAIARYLSHPQELGWDSGERINVSTPMRWVSPGWFHPHLSPARQRLLTWVDEEIKRPVVTARQNGTVIGRRRLPWPASPGRVFRLPWALLAHAQPNGGPIVLSL